MQGVYSFDGPGLDDQTADSPEYEEISSRIHSFVPESSIVGMLLDYHNEYTIVDSDGVGMYEKTANERLLLVEDAWFDPIRNLSE